MNRSMQRRHEDALAILASVPEFEPLNGADAATVTTYREVIPRALARVLIDHGNAAAAWAALPPAANDDPDVPYPFDELLLRGEVLCALGRGREALPLLERSLKIHAERNYAYDPAMARARATTGLCALAAGQRRRAIELAALARSALADQPDVSPYFRQASDRLNALLAPAGR
jgi:tetratricopeptide (TPR) repeat protein